MSYIQLKPTPASIGAVGTVTGNSGGAVPPSAGNINIVGSGGVIVTGNPGTNTLTITDSGSLRSTTYVATTPYTVLLTDDVILMDTATIASASTVKLPNAPGASSDGQIWTIKDWSGKANAYPISLTTVGGVVTIDGATSFSMANSYESVSVVWSQAEGTYSIVAAYGLTNLAYTGVNHLASPYTVLVTDDYISCDVTGGVITVKLPNAPATGKSYIIKDKVGLAATSNITITTVGGSVTIDGSTSVAMNTAYEVMNVIFNGSNYEIW